MSLDQNLFTLSITPREDSPVIIELVDPQGTVYYRKERLQASELYEAKIIDPLSESLLATITAPSASSKHKTIELHNPSVPVELKYTGTFSFKWSFKWENHDFDWKREECFLIRKPDPPVLVAITKEPPGRIKTKTVQILDYNLKRFDIDDRKGLEIVILSALLSFQDYSDEVHSNNAANTAPLLGTPIAKAPKTPEDPPPPELPPKPRKSGVEKIAEMQTGELSEITVDVEGRSEDYAQYCANLLEGDHMLFVVLRSASAATVPKVLEVAHQTKRIRHKAGLDDEDELYQYVQYDTHKATSLSGKKGPRVIKLDDDADLKDKYKPPESLTVHLSKIPLPELQPKAKVKDTGKGRDIDAASDEDRKKSKGKAKGKEKEKDESDKERKRWEREREKELQKREKEMKKETGKDKGKARARSLDRDDRRGTNRLAKPQPSSHVPPHKVHPNQPSPSPSQLNNPAIYAAPIPRPPPVPTLMPPAPNSYPVYAGHHRVTSVPGPGLMNYPQRPVSAYGPHLGPPQQPPPQQRAQSPSSVVNGLLGKLKAW